MLQFHRPSSTMRVNTRLGPCPGHLPGHSGRSVCQTCEGVTAASLDGTHRLAGVLREPGRAGTTGRPGSKKTEASAASMLADVHLPAWPNTNPPFSQLSLICGTTSCAGRVGDCHSCAVDHLNCVCMLRDAIWRWSPAFSLWPLWPLRAVVVCRGRAFADRKGTPSGQPPSLG